MAERLREIEQELDAKMASMGGAVEQSRVSRTSYGWVCPACGRGHSPWKMSCDCTGIGHQAPYSPHYPQGPMC